ncbi:MAG TPA: CAP domain-containing protein [Gaiellaceae bacterium]|jgi:uncharacterized protein YkwD|nr:CAP domain-containing protein [Gaiellaceae bacterium]
MKRSGGTSLVVLAAVASAVFMTPPAAVAATRDMAASLVASVNAVRAQHGLPQLHRARALDASALMKAEAIRSCGSFSHTPCGMPATRTFQRTGYFRGQVRVGENLYWGTGSLGSPASAIAAWLGSSPHRANLLGRWHDAGVGIVHASSLFGHADVWLFVLQFGRRG